MCAIWQAYILHAWRWRRWQQMVNKKKTNCKTREQRLRKSWKAKKKKRSNEAHWESSISCTRFLFWWYTSGRSLHTHTHMLNWMCFLCLQSWINTAWTKMNYMFTCVLPMQLWCRPHLIQQQKNYRVYKVHFYSQYKKLQRKGKTQRVQREKEKKSTQQNNNSEGNGSL